jgi:PAS domain S-box-containing protein
MGNGVVLRRHAGEWQEFNQTNGVPFSYIYCLAQGHPGEIWAGSHEAGLYMFREGRFHAISGTDASIRSVKVSRDGVVWVGTQSGGLSRLAPARAASYRVGDETRRGQVNGLVETPPSQFWVTTFGGGLFRGTMDRLEPVLGSQELNDLPFLNAGVSMRDGTLFFAGQKGLWRKDAGTGKIRGTILPDNPRALCEGVDGSLWLGTWEGELKRLVEGTPQVVKGGTFPAPVTGLVCGSGPALWVATHGAGLFRWEAGQAQWWTTAEGLPTDILLSLDWDAAGTLWIGTAGGGLAWLEKGRFHSVDARQGLGDSVVSQILEDGQGNLWLGCNRGIMRLSKGELRDVASGKAAAVHPLVLDESDGILTAECTGGYSPAGLRSRSGALYFSTVRGVVAVDPARFGPTPVPPAVLIEEVKLDGKTIPMSGGAFSLPPGPRELQIQYTAFNYAKPEQIRFRYRLQGGDEHWVEVEGARSVRFSQLRPGDYTFQVSAANQDGRWRETGASLAFTVLPFYWQTGWFRVVGALLFMGSGGGAVIWRNRAKRRLELVEMERLRRQSAERRQADEKFRLVVEASTNGIVLVNHSGRIVLVNAQTEELFGCSREKLIGQPVEMLVPERLRGAHPGQRAGFLAAPRARTMGAGRELFALRKDGMEFPVEIGLSPIQTAEGILVLTAIVDITARKQAEAEASRQRAELAHVARVSTMGELAASVAHELNQPLGAILANAEAADLFLNQNPPALDELRAILVDIRQDDERASEVIRRMRALLRKHELERLPLQINSVVEDVLQVVSGDAALRKIAIGAELALGLPKILGDRVHLQQVLLNLMLNGMDAMAGEPRERRRLSIRTRSSADGLVELAVVDSGHGIEPEKLPRLFEAFYTTKPNGMGMGLSISRTIIEAHHGRISAENNAGGGAVFRVALPGIG